MFFNQMGYLMPITYLPPTSHLQFYNLPTNPPTHIPRCITYLPIHPLITYLHIIYLFAYPPTYMDVLPTYLPTHLFAYMYYIHTYPHIYLHTCTIDPHAHTSIYIHVLQTHMPTHLFTYILPTHPLISYNLPTFILHGLVVKCRNKRAK
jgi:hypothetical protein